MKMKEYLRVSHGFSKAVAKWVAIILLPLILLCSIFVLLGNIQIDLEYGDDSPLNPYLFVVLLAVFLDLVAYGLSFLVRLFICLIVSFFKRLSST